MDWQAANAQAGPAVGTYAWLKAQWLRNQGVIGTVLSCCLLLGGPGAVLCLFASLSWYRRRSSADVRQRRLAQMQRMLARVDRRVRKRHFERQPHETLHQFADRLRAAPGDDQYLRRCADWYLQYANLRYAADEVDQDMLLTLCDPV